MMEGLLAIVRWIIVLPVWLLEHILKAMTLIILALAILVMAVLYPLFRPVWRKTGQSEIFKYATKWKGNYPMTKKVFDLWRG